MIEKQIWDEITGKVTMYKYSSIYNIEYEDVVNSDFLKYDRESILLIDKSKSPNMLYILTNDIEKTLFEIDCFNEEVRVNFVPHDFYNSFKRHGFTEWAEFADFFNEDIQGAANKAGFIKQPVFLDLLECETISDMSKKCKNQSRGFTGESAEWFADWLKENDIIVLKDNNEIIGFCCVSIYASGTILWIRELAVAPQYQGRGFGKMLMEQSIKYGADRGAKRGFLAADVLNKNAIRLYNFYGFVQRDTRGELQMIRTIKPIV